MKGGLLAPRGTKLAFILATLICTTIVIWGWDKTPFIVSLIPQNQPFKVSPDILISPTVKKTPNKQNKDAGNDLPTSVVDETSHKPIETVFDVEAPSNSSTKHERTRNRDILISPTVKKTPDELNKDAGNDLPTSVVDETSHKPIETVFDVEAPSNSSTKYDRTRNRDILISPTVKKTPNKLNKDAGNDLPTSVLDETSHKPIETVFDVEAPSNSSRKYDRSPNRACNYSKGKWVADDHRPFYSGGRCRQWLSEMWACRVTDRTDFSYEKFRWQPNDCDMAEFSGSKFLRRMRNKTLAFIGDSLGRQQFQSLMCMVSGGKERRDVIDVGWEFGLVKGKHAIRPDGWAYRFTKTNATILFYWSACLCDLQKLDQSDPKSKFAMHLDRPPSFLKKFLNKIDVLVLNTGHHWNRGKLDANHWVMHAEGIPTPTKNMVEAKNLAISSIVKWVDSKLPEHPNLRAFYRSISPRHFFNGDWNSGGTCDNINPLSKGREVMKDESGDPAAAMAVKGTNLTFLDITALSQLRDEGHISKYSIRPSPGMQDCLHWCLPGIPDTWNKILFAYLWVFGKKV